MGQTPAPKAFNQPTPYGQSPANTVAPAINPYATPAGSVMQSSSMLRPVANPAQPVGNPDPSAPNLPRPVGAPQMPIGTQYQPPQTNLISPLSPKINGFRY